MRSLITLFKATTALGLLLAACGGTAAPSTAPAPASVAPASSAAAKPSAAASASAKPAASAAASGKPAASGAASASAKPAASGSAAAKPTPTPVPRVAADTTEATITTYPIPGLEGKTTISADIMDIDQAGHLMVVGDTSSGGVDMWDISSATPKFLRTVKTPGGGPSGVIIAKNVNRIVAGIEDSTVVSIDMTTNQIVGTINTGGKKRADELDYDPKDKKVYIANSDDGIITAIDMTTFKVSHKFEDKSWVAIEQPRYDAADGLMYVTIRDPNKLVAFDPAKDEMVKTWDLPGTRSAGIWMNPKTNVGVISVQPRPIVWDFAAGKQVSTLDQAGTPDMIYYDAKTDLYFLGASGAPWGPTQSIVGGTPIKFITNVPSYLGAHQSAFDDTNNVVYFMGGTGNQVGLHGFPLPAKALGGAAASGAPAASGAAAKPAASAKPSA
jgi:DNA-binding beta-propeller fold protein YncE